MKPDRKKIYSKYDGHCAYCGCKLNGNFQIDHLVPRANFDNYVKNKRVPEYLSHLSIHSIETFRHEIGELVRRLNDNFTQFRIAKRFGLVEETGLSVKFYFEYYLPGEKQKLINQAK